MSKDIGELKMKSRPLEEISFQELLDVGVWEYDLDEEDYTDEQDETWLRPTLEVPVDDSFFGVFAVPVRLGNGQQIPAVLHCIDLREPTKDNTAAGLTVEKDEIRCCDEFDVMAQFLGLSMDDVFPITYDLSAYAIGHSEAVRGVINRPPDYSYEPNFTGVDITRNVD
jgi:hypothetical protein